jgi:glycosyltransferase involved in cell wall biosynthesis
MIPNIVWLPSITITKSQHENFTIIFLSRIHPKKGIDLLMEAISLLSSKPVLQIAGSGEEKYIQKLKQKANDLGIANNVQWLGWQDRDEKFSTLMKADLFALTSYNENFGNVVIEALHSGVPVLVSENTGLSEFVLKQNAGWVCHPQVHHIKLKLEEAMADQEKRNMISRTAPLKVYQYFSEEKLVPEYIRQYQS